MLTDRESTIGKPSLVVSLSFMLTTPTFTLQAVSMPAHCDLTAAAFLTQTVPLNPTTNIKFEIWDTVSRAAGVY